MPEYGWFPGMDQPVDRRMYVPERAPNAQNPNPIGGPLSQLAYRLAGSPDLTPGPGMMLPYSEYPQDNGGAGGIGGLGGVLGGNPLGIVNQGRSLLNPGDPAIQQPSKLNELGSKFGLTSGLSGGWGTGANLNAAVSSQLGGAPGALGAGSGGVLTAGAPASVLAADFGTIGSGAAANAALAEAGFGSGAAAGTGATAGTGASGGGVLGAAATPLAIAAAGWLAADIANKSLVAHGDEKRNESAFTQAFPGSGLQTVMLGKSGRQYGFLPDGTVVDPRYMENLMGAWYGATYAPDGNQSYWQQEYERLAANPQTATLPKGYVLRDGKIVKG